MYFLAPLFPTPQASVQKGTKALTQSDLEDKRKKGLYFWCAAKYTPGHKCIEVQLYHLLLDPQDDVDEEDTSSQPEEFLDCQEHCDNTELEGEQPPAPVLSLHAVHGS